MLCYAERTANLKTLGYDSYSDYLDSDQWRHIRRRIMKRDKGLCQICGDTATAVHHREYSVAALNGSDESVLAAICNTCHEVIEFRTDGRKVTTHQANKQFDSLKQLKSRKRRMVNGRVVDRIGRPMCVKCRRNPTKRKHLYCGKCRKSVR